MWGSTINCVDFYTRVAPLLVSNRAEVALRLCQAAANARLRLDWPVPSHSVDARDVLHQDCNVLLLFFKDHNK